MVILGAVLVALVLIAALGALIAKGHGFSLGPVWLMPFRLAHPDSGWARRFYGTEKLARARERYPAEAQMAAERDRELHEQWGDDAEFAGQDRITRRALKRAGYHR